jgi:hypothetical protein
LPAGRPACLLARLPAIDLAVQLCRLTCRRVTPRSKTKVKGKGMMDTYYLDKRITKIPPNRQWELVEKHIDQDVVAEVSG